MDIKPALVKELRERTGAGMMECKKALVETNGDIDAAAEWLRKAGAAKADKKASRVAAEGRVAIRSDEKTGRHVVLEVNSETDFVAKDDNFRAFVERVGRRRPRRSARPTSRRCCAAPSTAGPSRSCGSSSSRRSARTSPCAVSTSSRAARTVGAYVHGTRIGVLVELEGGTAELARDLAMQVASLAPRYVSNDDVPKDVLDKEREIILAQTAEEKKPPEILAKMVDGRAAQVRRRDHADGPSVRQGRQEARARRARCSTRRRSRASGATRSARASRKKALTS